MKVYIAVELDHDKPPVLLGVYRKEEDAEQRAYTCDGWGNVITAEVE